MKVEVNLIKKIRLKKDLKGECLWGKGVYTSPFPQDILVELLNNSNLIEVLEREKPIIESEPVVEPIKTEKSKKKIVRGHNL